MSSFREDVEASLREGGAYSNGRPNNPGSTAFGLGVIPDLAWQCDSHRARLRRLATIADSCDGQAKAVIKAAWCEEFERPGTIDVAAIAETVR